MSNIDGHIHIHNQPYTIETIQKMVDVAKENNIDELYILDHTHKFKEFLYLYENIETEFFERIKNHPLISVDEYFDFIKEIKKHEWPIKLHFGFEVCYFPKEKERLKKQLKSYEGIIDFTIGSVHFVDSIPVDYSKEIQERLDVDYLYKRYFEIVEDMIKSKLFTFLGHLDYARLYDRFPSYDVIPLYENCAKLLKEYNQEIENNTGLLRYGYPYGGMSPEFLKVMLKYDIKFHKSSDAHKAEDIGRAFNTIIKNI